MRFQLSWSLFFSSTQITASITPFYHARQWGCFALFDAIQQRTNSSSIILPVTIYNFIIFIKVKFPHEE